MIMSFFFFIYFGTFDLKDLICNVLVHFGLFLGLTKGGKKKIRKWAKEEEMNGPRSNMKKCKRGHDPSVP